MSSTRNDKPAHYRSRAQEARQKAEAATDEATRKTLLHDADLWERMAAHEEANPSVALPSYYPPSGS